MKKFLSLILALLMTVSCASVAFAADTAITATAAEEPSRYEEAISFLNLYGIYKGYGNSKMGANDDIQRYQMALFTSRIATGWVDDAAWGTGIWDSSYTEFTDVNEKPAADYLGAISYANQNGIIEGYGDGRFGPTDGITYQNALTMVVRALGYQNLNWPWGYIEKAVNLGLTAGIVDVAYTDVLTRGEVAQVIYNALFATTKDGTTLAAKNFGIKFGWETIIITASDGAFFAGNGEKTNEGVIAFKVVKADGTLGEDTYYAKNSDKAFGFIGHEDELAVGKAFKVCFGDDGLLCAKSLYNQTVWNLGKKNDAGKYPIDAYLASKTAVSKYTESTYLTKIGEVANNSEIIIAEGTYGTNAKSTVVDHSRLAIDWTNGNILEADEVDKDGKVVSYKVAWYYNQLLDQYYKIKTKSTGKDAIDGSIEIVGIDIMDDKDVEDLLKKQNVESTNSVKAYNILGGKPATSAYASLELFAMNGNEYGLYTSYRLGKIHQETKGCGHADKQFVVVDNLANGIADATYETINGKASASYSVSKVLCGQCGDCEKAHNDAWWTTDFAPEVDKDGKIVTNYVLYNFNQVTGELRVIKTIDKDAADGTYVATGVVRAYNVDKQTINIDGTTYSIKYDELEGNMFPTKDNLLKSTDTKAITASYLRGLFNQFVEFVVVDDAVVYIRAKSAGTKNYIVVDSYAGVASDGYIVVNAFSTDDLKLNQYRIGSYNGWELGDYFYYLDDATAKESFSKGVIYKVTSYDKAKDLYYVELAGEFDKAGKYVVNGISTTKNVTLAAGTDGYAKYGDKEYKMSAKDTYIIIGNENGNYVPMAVYTGKIPAGWTVTGDVARINDNLYLVVNPTAIVGFNYDEYAAGYVVYLKKATTTARYDVYDHEGDWYLLGASTFDAIVFDLLKGEEKVVTAQNVKLTSGYTYITLDGKIVDDAKFDIDGAWAELNAQFQNNSKTGKYIYGTDTFNSAWIDANGFVKKEFGKYFFPKLGMKEAHGLEIPGKVIALTIEDGLVTGWTDVTKNTAKYWNADTAYNCYYVYDVAAGSVVIYVAAGTTTSVTPSADIASDNLIQVDTDAYLTAKADYVGKEVDGKLVAATFNGVTFEFIGKATKDVHHAVELKDTMDFGVKGDCTYENWKTTVNGTPVYGSIDSAWYTCDSADCNKNLIKAVTVDFEEGIEVTSTDWTHFAVINFTTTDGHVYNLAVAAKIVDGKLSFDFGSPESTIDGTAATYIAVADANL